MENRLNTFFNVKIKTTSLGVGKVGARQTSRSVIETVVRILIYLF